MPKDPFRGIQPFDFGIPENDYEWKVHGAKRLLYNLTEKDRFERMKVNGQLPETLNMNEKEGLQNLLDKG